MCWRGWGECPRKKDVGRAKPVILIAIHRNMENIRQKFWIFTVKSFCVCNELRIRRLSEGGVSKRGRKRGRKRGGITVHKRQV